MNLIQNENSLIQISGGAPETSAIIFEVGALSGGWAASNYLQKVGGWAGVPDSAFMATKIAQRTGLIAAAVVGYQIGTAIYENSETVQMAAIDAVAAIAGALGFSSGGGDIFRVENPDKSVGDLTSGF